MHSSVSFLTLLTARLVALPPKADIRQRIEHVYFVPEADIHSASLGSSGF